jgi:hypothetical protein
MNDQDVARRVAQRPPELRKTRRPTVTATEHDQVRAKIRRGSNQVFVRGALRDVNIDQPRNDLTADMLLNCLSDPSDERLLLRGRVGQRRCQMKDSHTRAMCDPQRSRIPKSRVRRRG